jgi:hypothetical protein
MNDDELAKAIAAAHQFEADDPGQRWGWWDVDSWGYPWAEGVRIAEPGGPHCHVCHHWNLKTGMGGKCLVDWKDGGEVRWSCAHDVCDRFEADAVP